MIVYLSKNHNRVLFEDNKSNMKLEEKRVIGWENVDYDQMLRELHDDSGRRYEEVRFAFTDYSRIDGEWSTSRGGVIPFFAHFSTYCMPYPIQEGGKPPVYTKAASDVIARIINSQGISIPGLDLMQIYKTIKITSTGRGPEVSFKYRGHVESCILYTSIFEIPPQIDYQLHVVPVRKTKIRGF